MHTQRYKRRATQNDRVYFIFYFITFDIYLNLKYWKTFTVIVYNKADEPLRTLKAMSLLFFITCSYFPKQWLYLSESWL
jgi:hypothetical protein